MDRQGANTGLHPNNKERAMMARRKSFLDDIMDVLMITPWWFGPILAGMLYGIMRIVGSQIHGGVGGGANPFGMAIAAFAPILGFLVILAWIVTLPIKLSRVRLLNKQTGLNSIRDLSWREFERLVGEAFRREGYLVEEKGGSGSDGGVDLVLQRNGKKTLVQCKQWKSWKVGVRVVRELYGVMVAEHAAEGVVVTVGQFTNDATAFARAKPIRLISGNELTAMIREIQARRTASQTFPGQSVRPAAPVYPSRESSVGAGLGVNSASAANSFPAPDLYASVPPSSNSPQRYSPPIAQPGQPSAASPVPAPLCPRCGAAMVLRTAKRGSNTGSQFYGCSTYPRCKAVVNIR